ncbi:hypothetical protein FRX31_003843 [Thalictrum thalictroides]|uniref:Transmembrane protein n=1 Tax=Thalictrum thalictroides TaxID=46969 RepID=A0A7J6XDY7_THATH|nr:hypothetical protein FRX31_003843 [Thalictrum thalictroides]
MSQGREEISQTVISHSSMSPTMAPDTHQDELLFSGDKKYALHGEIMMVLFILFFAIFLSFLLLYFRFRSNQTSQDEENTTTTTTTTTEDHIPHQSFLVSQQPSGQHQDIKVANLGDFKHKFVLC